MWFRHTKQVNSDSSVSQSIIKEVSMTNTWVLRIFSRKYGAVAFKDQVYIADTFEQARDEAKRAFLEAYNADTNRASEKPVVAQMCDLDDWILAELQIRPGQDGALAVAELPAKLHEKRFPASN